MKTAKIRHFQLKSARFQARL